MDYTAIMDYEHGEYLTYTGEHKGNALVFTAYYIDGNGELENIGEERYLTKREVRKCENGDKLLKEIETIAEFEAMDYYGASLEEAAEIKYITSIFGNYYDEGIDSDARTLDTDNSLVGLTAVEKAQRILDAVEEVEAWDESQYGSVADYYMITLA